MESLAVEWMIEGIDDRMDHSLENLYQALEKPKTVVRVLLLDFAKAFDLLEDTKQRMQEAQSYRGLHQICKEESTLER